MIKNIDDRIKLLNKLKSLLSESSKQVTDNDYICFLTAECAYQECINKISDKFK